MNLVIFHTHDTGRYIEPYGIKADNPNLMRVAQEGVIFRQVHNCAPTCSPSRSGMMCGTSAHECGSIGLSHRGFGITKPQWHLSHHMKANGLQTALCGIQHEVDVSDEHLLGFDKRYNANNFNKEVVDLEITEKACEYIKKQDDNFYLAVGLHNTHKAFIKSEYVNPNYVKVPGPLPDCPEIRQDYANFLASLKIVDNCLGKVIDALEEKGILDDTILVYTTDHGVPFPFMKCQLYDSGTGVSLLIRMPKAEKNGSASDKLISQVDLYPTLCDLLGIEKPSHLTGNSFAGEILNYEYIENEAVFSEVTFHAAYEPERMIRTKRYKLIKRYVTGGATVTANMDPQGYTTNYLKDNGIRDYNYGEIELYDVLFDPNERKNLAFDEKYKDILEDLENRLSEWMIKTNDPLLETLYVKMPDGARVNKNDCDTPDEEEFVDVEKWNNMKM